MSYPTDEQIAEAVTQDEYEDRIKAVKRLILQTRIEESNGFDHGGSDWSSNWNEEEIEDYEEGGHYAYEQRLRKEMENV